MNKSEPVKFPWHEIMAFGFGHLRLTSAGFWAMTPREIAAAMQAHGIGTGQGQPLHALRQLIDRDE